jgi:hypothetical protein
MNDDALLPSSEAVAATSAVPAAALSAAIAAPAAQQDCPECGRPTPADPRFALWCAACGWNTDPTPPEPPRGRMRVRAAAVADRLGARRHAELHARSA